MKTTIIIPLIFLTLSGMAQPKQDTAWYAILPDTGKWIPVQAIRHFEPYVIKRVGYWFEGTRSVVDCFIDPVTKKRINFKIIDQFEL